MSVLISWDLVTKLMNCFPNSVINHNAEFCCGNEDSDNYGVPTMYDDSCDDFEEKE